MNPAPAPDAPLLSVDNLSVHFARPGGAAARAVDGVSFAVRAGETLGLVGESGCGKSVTSLALLRLVPEPPGVYAGGRVLFRGRDVLALPPRALRAVRGGGIAMVFQEPMSSLNPVFTVGQQLAEALAVHQRAPRPDEPEARGPDAARFARGGPAWVYARVRRALAEVGIPHPEVLMRQYPHELSGGMKQRAMIAMALVCGPGLLVCDEPTTALDVTIQAQILDLLRDLQAARGMGMLFITHNLGVVAGLAHRVAVMYAGRIVEEAPTDALFDKPLHPYTIGLFACVPRLDAAAARRRLATIPGRVPDPSAFPEGCRFHPRCPLADGVCRAAAPELAEPSPGRRCACHHADRAAAWFADHPFGAAAGAEAGPDVGADAAGD